MDAAALHIRLLGELELRVEGGAPLRLGSQRAESLLSYLLLHRHAPQPRARLAGLLWPDSNEEQARTNLRHLLHTLRRSLPDADTYLEVTKATLRWGDGGPFWLDVAAFEDALDRAAGLREADETTALREAIDLYRRDLLEGHYDDWVLGERERLRRRYLDALERLVSRLEQQRDLAQAVTYAERLVRHDPLREEPYRILMRLHDARGDRAKALRVFHACSVTLDEELGVAPSAGTREVYAALLGAPDERPTVDRSTSARGRTPLVGREIERRQLNELWRGSAAGRAHLAVVSGEPGVGKTRLVDELHGWVTHHGGAVATARSYRAEGELAFGPLVAWLRSRALAPTLPLLDASVRTELVALLPELGTDAVRAPDHGLDLGRRQATFDALVAAFLAPRIPLLLVADDLHWADRDTLRFVRYLLRTAPEAPLLVAATARREELESGHPLTQLVTELQRDDAVTEVELDRLSPSETRLLARHETGRELTDDDAERLHEDTEGNPLFVLEALRGGWAPGAEASMTPRVQAVIEARLQHLSSVARDVLGVAATIGRAFTTDILAAATVMDDDTLVRALDELWHRRLIRDQAADAYDFSHDRIREVAYLGLGPAQRRLHHLRVAVALERAHRGDPAPVSAQLAAHHESAGDADGAIRWYELAATTAQRMHAHAEAIRLLGRALDLLRTLPPSQDNRVRELTFVTALQAPLGALEGWSSPNLDEVRQRGLTLAAELGVDPAAPLLQSLGLTRVTQGHFALAQQTAAQLVTSDSEADAEAAAVQGEYVLGITAYWSGRLADARHHFETAASRHRPEQIAAHLSRFGLDPKVVCVSRLSNTLWFLGQPRTAVATRDRALALGHEIGHPHSLGIVLVFAASLAIEQRAVDDLRSWLAALEADAALRVPAADVAAATFRAYLDVLDGHPDTGIDALRGMLDHPEQSDHAPGMRASVARALLEACIVCGDADRGLMAAERALAMGGAATLWQAEAHRLRAAFLAAQAASPEAVAGELESALALACQQGARAYELRAATDLLRWRSEHEHADSCEELQRSLHALLAELPEAADTADGVAAAALLHA